MISIWHTSGTSVLYLKYGEKLKEYINKESLNDYECQDFIIKLHFCFEYAINNMFRNSEKHNVWFDNYRTTQNAKELAKLEIEFNKIPLITKIEYYLWLKEYTNEENKITPVEISKKKAKNIKNKIIKFLNYRNIVYHGSELSVKYENDEGLVVNLYSKHNLNYIEDYTRKYISIIYKLREIAHENDKLFLNQCVTLQSRKK